MNKKLVILVVIIILLVGVFLVSYSSEINKTGDLNVTSNLTRALDDSESIDKTVILIFDQEGCYYCDLLKEDTLSDDNVQKVLNRNS